MSALTESRPLRPRLVADTLPPTWAVFLREMSLVLRDPFSHDLLAGPAVGLPWRSSGRCWRVRSIRQRSTARRRCSGSCPA